MSSPAASSNPADYVREHDMEYRELLDYGEAAKDYCFGLFEQGGQTG